MLELREVFEMTTKQIEPNLDSWRKQEERQHRSARRRKMGALAVAAVIAIAAAIGIAWSIGTGREGTPAERPAPPLASGKYPYMVTIGSSDTTELPRSLVSGHAFPVSPDGTRFAFGPCCDPGARVSVVDVDGSNPRVVTPRGLDAFGPSWSPDGSSLLYQGRDAEGTAFGELYVLDLARGEQTRITHLPGQNHGWWFMGPAFGPGGEAVVFHRPDPALGGGAEDERWDLWSVPATGGDPALVLRNAGFAQFSPADGTMAFLRPIRESNFAGGGLWLADPDAENPRRLVEGEGIWWPRWSPDGTRIAYARLGKIHVVDVATDATMEVARGGVAEWFDDRTLVVTGG